MGSTLIVNCRDCPFHEEVLPGDEVVAGAMLDKHERETGHQMELEQVDPPSSDV